MTKTLSSRFRMFALRSLACLAAMPCFACNDPVSLSRDPIPVRTNRLASSGREVCLVQTDGTAKCWGEHGARRLTLPDGRRFIRLSGGINHLCGLANDSTAWCWGRSNEGQLGNGKTTGGLLPERVETTIKFIAVAVGGSASCGLDGAGLLYCWGGNRFAELANGRWGAQEFALAPTRAKSNLQFRDVIGGGCALSLAQHVYCWNALEGVAFSGYFHAEPGSGAGVYAIIPVRVLGDEKYRQASGFCPLSVDGVAHCWGSNAFGRLGIGDGPGVAQPTPVRTSERFVEISSKINTCALTATGEVWCWGPNTFGINGPTATGDRSMLPVRVELPPL